MIRRGFGVVYHPPHMRRIVRALGLCLQKAMRQAIQRDEEAIRRFKEERWAKLNRGR